MDLLQLVLLVLLGIASKCIAGDVTVLTSDNFDSIALNPKKDVLVEFFAPCEFPRILLIHSVRCRLEKLLFQNINFFCDAYGIDNGCQIGCTAKMYSVHLGPNISGVELSFLFAWIYPKLFSLA